MQETFTFKKSSPRKKFTERQDGMRPGESYAVQARVEQVKTKETSNEVASTLRTGKDAFTVASGY